MNRPLPDHMLADARRMSARELQDLADAGYALPEDLEERRAAWAADVLDERARWDELAQREARRIPRHPGGRPARRVA